MCDVVSLLATNGMLILSFHFYSCYIIVPVLLGLATLPHAMG